MKNKIIQGDCLEVLKTLPSESINMCMTSPPYWALRDYGVEGQLGLEPTFEEHIQKMCDIFDEVKRVLKKDGTCWVNYGDTYAGSPAGNFGDGQPKPADGGGFRSNKPKCQYSVPNKSLTMIPFRFAIEMVNRGWILRNVIIWHKPNPMPSSAKDRFTVDFEYLFFFSKNKKYWFEQQFDPLNKATVERNKYPRNPKSPKAWKEGGMPREKEEVTKLVCNPQGRNTRTVWKIPTQPFPEAHFAVYPEKLCITPIKAGCPEFICKKCGKAREKIYEKGKLVPTGHGPSRKGCEVIRKYRGESGLKTSALATGAIYEKVDKGYSDCKCKGGWRKGIVLDPFMGAGTTAVVARKLGREYLGIELNKEYIKIAEKRLSQQVLL